VAEVIGNTTKNPAASDAAMPAGNFLPGGLTFA
jgi:hypothetical protein